MGCVKACTSQGQVFKGVGEVGNDSAKGKCGTKTVTALKVTAMAIAIAAVVFGVLSVLQLNGVSVSEGFAGFNAIGTTGAYALIGVGGGALIAYPVIKMLAKQCEARRQSSEETASQASQDA